ADLDVEGEEAVAGVRGGGGERGDGAAVARLGLAERGQRVPGVLEPGLESLDVDVRERSHRRHRLLVSAQVDEVRHGGGAPAQAAVVGGGAAVGVEAEAVGGAAAGDLPVAL